MILCPLFAHDDRGFLRHFLTRESSWDAVLKLKRMLEAFPIFQFEVSL
jgi:hypothetical protein